MTPELILAIVVGLGGPASGIVIAIITNRRARRDSSESETAAQAMVKVSERDAHTREIGVILDGYTAVNQAMGKSLERAEEGLGDCNERYDALNDKYDALEARFGEFELAKERERVEDANRRREMINHIMALESLIPTPPGPPARPAWD